MHDSERDKTFGDWMTGHKGILFKVVHAYAFEHADRQGLFQEIIIQVWRSVDAFRGDYGVARVGPSDGCALPQIIFERLVSYRGQDSIARSELRPVGA